MPVLVIYSDCPSTARLGTPPRGSSTLNHLFLPSSPTSRTSLHFCQTLHAYLYGLTETLSSSTYTGATLTWLPSSSSVFSLSYTLSDDRQSSPGARSCTHIPKILRPSTSPIFKITTPPPSVLFSPSSRTRHHHTLSLLCKTSSSYIKLILQHLLSKSPTTPRLPLISLYSS